MPKGPFSTQYIGGIVADQLSKMAATIIGSSEHLMGDLPCVQLASYLEGSLLMWMMLLHLHVTSKCR